MHLTKRQARQLLLAQQGLWPPHALSGKAGALAHIRRVRCIQYDPLNVTGSNPELVLQARVADFRPHMLNELLYQDRALLDGYDKVMSIYPAEDWPYFRRRRDAARARLGNHEQPAVAILTDVRHEIRSRGPLSSLDLDFHERVDWSWAPTRLARAALESMYQWGELVIHHKVHTRKVYDFADRHLPAQLLHAPEPNPSDEQYHEWYVLRRLGSLGLCWNLAGEAWLGVANMKSQERSATLGRLMDRNAVIEVTVDGVSRPCYLLVQDLPLLDEVLQRDHGRQRASILAPLDNLLWDRRFIRELFDFYYIWEVYKPAQERQFGYYVLPILYGDRFVARFEPVRDRKLGTLTVKDWWWEEGARPSGPMKAELRRCLRRFAHFLGVQSLRLDSALAKKPHLEWLEQEASRGV